jgi:putative Mg2+ transporter-C (MgtC) family protein
MSIEVLGVLRLLLAALLGGIIGLQREWVGKEAGVRTNMLIGAGSAIFTLVSIYGFPGSDPSRLAAGVVTGVGFIGAGIILHRSGGAVVGLTTAATMWTVAGIGVAAGAGLYMLSIAATFITLVALLMPHLHKH